MMCFLAGLSPGQIAAFRDQPELASDFAQTSVIDLLDARVNAGLASLPSDVSEQYQKAKRDLMAENPSLRQQSAKQDASRPVLAKLGPFEPPLELGKAWHILHYLMTGHTDASAAPGNALLSGTPLVQDIGYGSPRLHDPGETRAFRGFLAPLETDRLLARMDFPQLVHLRVYPLLELPNPTEAESWRHEIARSFKGLKSYANRAAAKGEGLLIWLS